MSEERRLAAIMFTDMVGYTALMGRDEARARRLVERSRAIQKSLVARFHGQWLEEVGDGTLSAFSSAVEAVDCALAIQQSMHDEPEIILRIGIHLGDVVFVDGRVYGDGVNVASRIESLAFPGGIAVSEAVGSAVRGHFPAKLSNLGRKRLKNVAQPVRVYALETKSESRPLDHSFFRSLWARWIPQVLLGYVLLGLTVVWISRWFAALYGLHERLVDAVILALVAMTPGLAAYLFFRGDPGHSRRSVDRDRRWHPGRFAITINLVAVLGIVGFVLQDAPFPGEAAASIAVLPFANVSAEAEENDYFSDGLTDELISALSRLDALNVAARRSSFMFKESQKDVQEIAEQLGVRHILEGSVRKSGKELRVFVQLVDARTGYNVWQHTYEKELDDIFKVQEDIARSVVSGMGVILPPRESAELGQRPTDDLEAYNFYLQGLEYLHRPLKERNLDLAENLFHNALTLDPGFAQAHSGLCRVALQRYELTNAPHFIDEGKSACQRAMQLDKTLLEVQTSLGSLYLHTGQLDEADRLFRGAIEAAPRRANAWVGLGRVLAKQGGDTVSEAEGALRQAVELQPADWSVHMALGEFLYWENRFDAADRSFQRVMELTPDNPRALNFLGSAYLVMGNLDKSIETLGRSLDLTPTRQGFRNLGLAYYMKGDYEATAGLMKKAIELGPNDHWSWGSKADALRYLEHGPEATAAYRRAIELARAVLERDPGNAATRAAMAVYLARVGKIDAAREAVKSALVEAPEDPEISYYSAKVELTAGNTAGALKYIKQAIRNGFSAPYLLMDPDFAELRSNETFKGLVQDT